MDEVASAPPLQAGAYEPFDYKGPPQPACMDAWVIACKPLVRGQLTLEQASRVVAAVRMLRNRPSEPPAVVCFCGSEFVEAAGPQVERPPNLGPSVGIDERCAAFASYSFFMSVVEAQGLSLQHTSVVVEQQGQCLADGLLLATVELRACTRARSEAMPPGGGGAGGEVVRLFSTEHHLERVHDIDVFLPSQSLLAPLREMRAQVLYESVSNPYAYSTDRDVSRHSRHAILAAQLEVVRVNLRGIMQRTERLQPPIWQRLREVRRALADEQFAIHPTHGYRRPLPKRQHTAAAGGPHGYGAAADDGGDGDCELQLVEEAVSKLGKVIAIIEPLAEDPIYGVVGGAELHEAKQLLMGAVACLRLADPDRPMSPTEWQQFVLYLEAGTVEGTQQ